MEVSNQILSEITVYMKYAKYNEELGRRETWEELVTRNKAHQEISIVKRRHRKCL